MEETTVAITQVLNAEPCLDAEDLVSLTRKEADALSDEKAGERLVAIGEHCTSIMAGAQEKATAFLKRHLDEILSMRARYSQPGRRNPIPEFPTWKQVKDRFFWFVSDSHLRRLLAAHKAEKVLEEAQPEPVEEEIVLEGAEGMVESGTEALALIQNPEKNPKSEAVPAETEEMRHRDKMVSLKESWASAIAKQPRRPGAMVSFFSTLDNAEQEDILISITKVLKLEGTLTADLRERYAEAFAEGTVPGGGTERRIKTVVLPGKKVSVEDRKTRDAAASRSAKRKAERGEAEAGNPQRPQR